MIPLLLLAAAALGLTLSGLFSGMETGVYCLNRARLALRSGQKDPAALRVAALLERRDDVIITALAGTTVADYVASVSVAALLLWAAVSPGLTEIYTTLLVTPLVFVFGNAVPKNWFRQKSDRLMYALSGPLAICCQVLRLAGILGALRGLTRLVLRLVDRKADSQDAEVLPRTRMLRLLHEGAARGGLSAFQRDTIDRVLKLSQVRVDAVMIPWQRCAAVPIDLPRDEFLRVARMAHFSRLPAHRGKGRQVVGIVNVYDVLTDEAAKPIAAHVRDPLVLQSWQSVPTALLQLQRARQAMAIVRDRSGDCIGILTVKDLVEEIVGELEVW